MMMTLTAAARVLGASFEGEDGAFAAVSTDSRAIGPGQLFVALRGERFDGHRFLADVAARGAAGAIVSRDALHAAADRSSWAQLPLVIVTDTRVALGMLAAAWRNRHTMPLVGLTGSSGKTTVKEMLAAILREAAVASGGAAADVLATRGNLNNDIGVPLTLLELRAHHRYAVIEMGMNHAGEIRYLAQLAAPDVVLVNNAGRAHIEFLGSEEAIARAKGEIYEDLRADAVAVVNADDRYAPLWRTLIGTHDRVEFGLEQGDVSAAYTLHPASSDVTLRTPRGEATFTLKAPGLHNVRNALAAASAALALDIAVDLIAAGLGRYAGVTGRLQQSTGPHGSVVIDDTYNANPDSVRAAIDVLAGVPGRRFLVLGDMGELGAHGAEYHAEIGEYARGRGLDGLYLLGELTREAARAYGAGGRHFDSVETLVEALLPHLDAHTTLLVKGSRFMRMERVVERLTGSATAGH